MSYQKDFYINGEYGFSFDVSEGEDSCGLIVGYASDKEVQGEGFEAKQRRMRVKDQVLERLHEKCLYSASAGDLEIEKDEDGEFVSTLTVVVNKSDLNRVKAFIYDELTNIVTNKHKDYLESPDLHTNMAAFKEGLDILGAIGTPKEAPASRLSPQHFAEPVGQHTQRLTTRENHDTLISQVAEIIDRGAKQGLASEAIAGDVVAKVLQRTSIVDVGFSPN